MARPRLVDEPRVSTQVRLPESLYDRLKSAAQDRDVSANLIVTRALTEFLDHLTPADVVLAATRETTYKEVG
jgi:predicted transcriptional regulator